MTETARWIEYLPLQEIAPAPVNPKKHHQASIRASLDRFGYVEAIARDERTGRLVAGHGRLADLLAASERGEAPPDGVTVAEDGSWLVPVQRGWSSRDDVEAEAYLIASNRTSELGGWDDDELTESTARLRDADEALLATITSGDRDPLLTKVREHDRRLHGDTEDTPPEEPPVVPVTRAGDVWELGPHRLVCGDSRDPAVVARLLDGAAINLAFTSPPYAEQREYDETSGFKPVPPDEYVEWFAPVAANVAAHLAPDGSWFVNIKPSSDGLDTSLYVFDLVIAHVREWGWHFATEFCWERNGVPKNVTQRFKNQFEPVYQFARGRWKMRPHEVRYPSDHVPKAAGPGVGNTGWADNQGGNGPMFGKDRKRTSTHRDTGDGNDSGTNWSPGEMIGPGMAFPGNRLPTMSGSHEALGHTAAFPVGLPEWFIRAYTDEGDAVFDPFMGSGSTLIAADRQHRIGYGVEISPGYCDVVAARYQTHTGEKPTRNGEPHDFGAHE